MNYLALCRRVALECGVTASASIPAAVTGQTGELLRICNWVAAAWDEIQGKHPGANGWRWMRSRFTVNTSSGDDTYAGTDCTDEISSTTITRFASWIPFDDEGRYNVKIYLQSAGVGTERYLMFMPWAQFRAQYKLGTQNNSAPAHYTIDPQNNLVLGPKPDGTYVVSGEYQKSAQSLAADGDTPECPSRFHMLVVYRAMEKYGAYESAVEVFNRGQFEGNRLERQLELDQLPAIALAEPLA